MSWNSRRRQWKLYQLPWKYLCFALGVNYNVWKKIIINCWETVIGIYHLHPFSKSPTLKCVRACVRALFTDGLGYKSNIFLDMINTINID